MSNEHRHPHCEIAKLWFEDRRRRVEANEKFFTGWVQTLVPTWNPLTEYRFAAPIDSEGREMVEGRKYRSDGEEFLYIGRMDEINFAISKKTSNWAECSIKQWDLDGAEPVVEFPEAMEYTGGVPEGFRLLTGDKPWKDGDYVLHTYTWRLFRGFFGGRVGNAIAIRRVK